VEENSMEKLFKNKYALPILVLCGIAAAVGMISLWVMDKKEVAVWVPCITDRVEVASTNNEILLGNLLEFPDRFCLYNPLDKNTYPVEWDETFYKPSSGRDIVYHVEYKRHLIKNSKRPLGSTVYFMATRESLFVELYKKE
jgi:hypothetical protein